MTHWRSPEVVQLLNCPTKGLIGFLGISHGHGYYQLCPCPWFLCGVVGKLSNVYTNTGLCSHAAPYTLTSTLFFQIPSDSIISQVYRTAGKTYKSMPDLQNICLDAESLLRDCLDVVWTIRTSTQNNKHTNWEGHTLFLGCSLFNLMLVQVVLLGKLHVLQELGVTSWNG